MSPLKIEREARELNLDAVGRQQLRQQRSKTIAESLRQWLTRQRNQVYGRFAHEYHRRTS